MKSILGRNGWKLRRDIGSHNSKLFAISLHRFVFIKIFQVNRLWMLTYTSGGLTGINRSTKTLHWRHKGRDGVSNHQPHDCLLNRLFRRILKKTSKLRVTGLCAGNSPVTGEFPAQRSSNAENVSIWWCRHHGGCPIFDILAIGAQRNIAQGTTPMLSWHVQICCGWVA